MRTKHKIQRIISYLLALVLFITSMSITSYGWGGITPEDGDITGNADWGRTGYQISVGLGKCTNDWYNAETDGDLYDWLNNTGGGYFDRYYTPILSNRCYSVQLSSHDYKPTTLSNDYTHSPSGLISKTLTASDQSSWYPGDAEADAAAAWLYTIMAATTNGTAPNLHILTTTQDAYFQIKPEYVHQLMQAFKDEPLYYEWLAQSSKTCYQPVILVFEMSICCKYKDGRNYFMRAGDLADTHGSSAISLYTLDIKANGGERWNNKSTDPAKSATSTGYYLNHLCTTTGEDNRLINGLFGVNHNGYAGDGSIGYGWACNILSQFPDKAIDGCYAINLTGGPTDWEEPPDLTSGDPGKPKLSGNYTWHINADDLISTPLKFSHVANEDQAVEVSSVGGKNVKIGHVDISQQDIGSWIQYYNSQGNKPVIAELTIKKVSTSNYTQEKSKILSEGTTVGTTSYHGDLKGFIEYLKGTKYFDLVPVVTDDVANDVVNGIQNAVAYATTMKVTVDGAEVPFSNNQVHYAIWATKGTGKRAYNFQQVVKAGATQIKADSLGEASYDALSGIPTTENLFIDQGGQQWIVNVQFRMCVDKYQRKYSVEVPEYANYLYYSTGLNEGADNTWGHSYSGHSTRSGVAHSGTRPTDSMETENFINSTYKDFESTIDTDLKNDSIALNTWIVTQLNALYGGITNNHLYSADYKYDYLADSCSPLSVTADGVIEYKGGLKAYDDDNAAKTVADLENQLKALATGTQSIVTNMDKPTHPTADIGHKQFTLDLVKTSSIGNDLDSPTNTNVKVVITVDGSNTATGTHAGSTDFNHTNKNHKGAGPWSLNATNCGCSPCDGEHLCSQGSCSKGRGHNATSCSIGGSTHWTQTTHTNTGTCSGCSGTGKVADTSAGAAADAKVDCTTCGGDGKVDETCTAGACSKCGLTGSTPGKVTCAHADDKQLHWNSPSGQQPDCSKQVEEEWAVKYDGYKYEMSAKIEIIFGEFVYESQGEWNPSNGKMLSYKGDFSQIYDSVKYLEITDVHCWRLTGGMQKGLSALFPQSEKIKSTGDVAIGSPSDYTSNEIINMFCNLKGFYFYCLASEYPVDYPLDDTTCEREFQSYTQTDGTVYETWRSESDAVSKPLYTTGRLANSFLPGNEICSQNRDINAIGEDNISITQKNASDIESYAAATPKATGSYINDDCHAMKAVIENDDEVKFTYSIGEQGGRSHKSFPGFMKQALARTFYFPDANNVSDAKNAYSNYIVVQSDFFAVTMAQNEDWLGTSNADTPLSFVGNQYSTDWFIDRITGTETGADATLLSTDPSMTEELVKYGNWESPWVIDKKNTDLDSNSGKHKPVASTRTSNLIGKVVTATDETYADDTSNGRGTTSVISVPTVLPIKTYALRGRKNTDGNGYIVGFDESEVSFKERLEAGGSVSLTNYNADNCEKFGQWVPDTLCGDENARGTGLLTDFSGTFLTAGIKEDEGLPWIGYKGDGATNVTDTHGLYVSTMNGQQVNYCPYTSYIDFNGGGSGTTSAGVHAAIGFTQDFGRKMASYQNAKVIPNSNVWLAELSSDPDALGYMTSSCVDTTELEFTFDPATMTGNSVLTSIQHGTNYGSRKTTAGYDPDVNKTGVDKLFPHSSNHNLDRYIHNGKQLTGWGALGYDCVLQFTKLIEGVVPIPNVSTGSWTDKFTADDSNDKHILNNGIIIPASSNSTYTDAGATAQSDNAVTNYIIILDPVSAINVALVGDSDLLPDATNQYIDEVDADGVVVKKHGYNIRDQRVQPTTADFDGGADIDSSIDNEVTIVADTNISKTPVPTTEHYEMKDTSTIATTSARPEHYAYTGDVASNVIDIKPTSEGVLATTVSSANKFTSEGEYFLSYFTDSNAEHQATVRTELEYNDVIKVVGTSLYLERNFGTIQLNYTTIRDSILKYYQEHVPEGMQKPEGAGVDWYYQQLFGDDDVDDVIHFRKDATIEIDLSAITLPKGASISIALPFAQNVQTSDFDIQVASSAGSDTTKYATYTYVSADGKTMNIVIEAHDKINLGKTKLVYVNNAVSSSQGIKAFSDTCVSFNDIWLCDLGNLSAYDGTFAAIGTIQHEYEYGVYHKTVAERKASYNQYACSLFLEKAAWKVTTSLSVFSNHLYAYSATKHVTWEFTEEFYNNPHIIETSYWRAYIAGFGVGQSQDRNAAKVIVNPWNPDEWLDDDENWLFWPDGSNADPIKIKDFKEQACLVKFDGKLYVSLKDDALQHRITQISTQVGEFDSIYFGLDIYDNVSYKMNDLPASMAGFYPIKSNYFVDDVSPNYTKEEMRSRTYEYCFALDTASNKPLYCVGSAYNAVFRYSWAIDIDIHGEDAMTDWDVVSEKINIVLNGSDSALQSNVISLDDEFSIYWDNVDNITSQVCGTNYETKIGKSPQNENSLGAGWGHYGDDIEISSDAADFSKHNIGVAGYTEAYPNANFIWKWQNLPSVNKQNNMDTTKWIASKYITFDFGVYVPVNDAGVPNPTIGFFYDDEVENADGSKSIVRKLRPITYVKAGDPIYLGISGEKNGRSGPGINSSNGGTFVDFGTPQFDVNGNLSNEPYTYHFWCALDCGESRSKHAYCTTIAINDLYVGDSTNSNNNPGYVGNTISTEKTNITSGVSSTRTTGVTNELTFGVIGRIGALTIVDSGDPTYSDTFKYSDLPSNNVGSYLIYKLVKRIDSYSNVKAKMGSQRAIVLDPFDVRGRIAANDMKSLFVDSLNTDESIGEVYKHSHANSPTNVMHDLYQSQYHTYEFGLDASTLKSGYNTYGTQWYKAGNGTYSKGSAGVYRYMLPLNPNNVFKKSYSDIDEPNTDIDHAKVGDGGRHEPLMITQTKLGYELFCTLESIGNYYGTSDSTNHEATNETVNDNGDFGQYKVQIRPIYYYVSKDGNTVYPVDVYMQKAGNYVMINSGGDAFDSLTPLKNSHFPYYLETNTEKTGNATDGYHLDQNMLRRSVTKEESIKTWFMTQPDADGNVWSKGSMLTPFQQSVEDGDLGQTEMSSNYCYGNSQYLFLRKRNLTYVGGETEALGYAALPSISSVYRETVKHAQKWYFGLSLPSSSKFVKTGSEFTSETIIKEGYILCVVEVYAIGDTWTLKYKSDVSKITLNINGIDIPWEKYHKSGGFDREWLIPINYYDIEKSSMLDLNTEGSH